MVRRPSSLAFPSFCLQLSTSTSIFLGARAQPRGPGGKAALHTPREAAATPATTRRKKKAGAPPRGGDEDGAQPPAAARPCFWLFLFLFRKPRQ